MKHDPLFRFALILISGFILFASLFYAKEILIPISFAVLLAFLLIPVCKKIESWHIPRGPAVFLCMLSVVIVFSGFVFLLSTQLINLGRDFPSYVEQLNQKVASLQGFVEKRIHMAPDEQINYLEKKGSQLLSRAGQFFATFFLATTGTLFDFLLVLIYTFFMLYLRDHFKNFLLQVSKGKDHENARRIIGQSGLVTARYLSGVFTVVVILAILNSVGLLIIGLDHAIFFGILAAVLNVVPYIGILIGGALPVIMALVTMESLFAPVAVIILFVVIQFIENNILTPRIVGSQIQINPLATIFTLIVGGSLWGIAGMVLSLPLLGVVKIFLDNIHDLKPYGYLIGADMGKGGSLFHHIRSIFSKKKSDR